MSQECALAWCFKGFLGGHQVASKPTATSPATKPPLHSKSSSQLCGRGQPPPPASLLVKDSALLGRSSAAVAPGVFRMGVSLKSSMVTTRENVGTNGYV